MRARYQSLSTGIVVQIVELLLPKLFTVNSHRMAARLPESAFSVDRSIVSQCRNETAWPVINAIIAQFPTGELAKIGECLRQSLGIKISVECDHVYVRRHDDIGIDAKIFLSMAEGKTICDDLAGRRRDKNRKPFDDRVGQEIDR